MRTASEHTPRHCRHNSSHPHDHGNLHIDKNRGFGLDLRSYCRGSIHQLPCCIPDLKTIPGRSQSPHSPAYVTSSSQSGVMPQYLHRGRCMKFPISRMQQTGRVLRSSKSRVMDMRQSEHSSSDRDLLSLRQKNNRAIAEESTLQGRPKQEGWYSRSHVDTVLTFSQLSSTPFQIRCSERSNPEQRQLSIKSKEVDAKQILWCHGHSLWTTCDTTSSATIQCNGTASCIQAHRLEE